MDIPDWLWQELAADVIWTGIGFGAAWAWRKRKVTLDTLRARRRQPVLLSGQATFQSHITDELAVGKDAPSLARRLEELASWYLHVS